MSDVQAEMVPRKEADHAVRSSYFRGGIVGLAIGFAGACVAFTSPPGIEEEPAPDPPPPSTAEELPDAATCSVLDGFQMPVDTDPEAVEVELPHNLYNTEYYLQQLRTSASFEESGGILNEVFGNFSVSVHVAELPEELATAQTISHRPEQITQHLLDVSARKVLSRMQDIPVPLLTAFGQDDLRVYLTDGITDDSREMGAYYTPAKDGRSPALVLSVGANYDTADRFMWGFTTILMDQLCPESRNGTDQAYLDLNPDDFTYTGEEDATEAYNYQDGYTVVATQEGMASQEHDIRVAYQTIFNGSLKHRFISPDWPLHAKLELLLQRIATIDEASARYLAQP